MVGARGLRVEAFADAGGDVLGDDGALRLEEPGNGVVVGPEERALDQADGALERRAERGEGYEHLVEVGGRLPGRVVEDDVGQVLLVGDDLGRCDVQGRGRGLGSLVDVRRLKGAASGAVGAESVGSISGADAASSSAVVFAVVFRVRAVVAMDGSS